MSVFLFFVSLHSSANADLGYDTVEDTKDSRKLICHPTLHKLVHNTRKDRWKFPVIANLNKYIELFTTRKCLIVLDNFQKINFKIPSWPLILRRPVPLCQTEYKGYNNFKEELWGPGNLKFKNVSESLSALIKCPLSKFLNGTGIFKASALPDACIRINLRTFSKHIKPWGCEVHFVVYPILHPKESFGEFWPSPFSTKTSNKLYSYTYTSSVPKIHIYIRRIPKAKEIPPDVLKHWLFEILNPKAMATPDRDIRQIGSPNSLEEFRRTDTLICDVFLVMNVARSTPKPSPISLGEALGFIVRVYSLKLVPGDWNKKAAWKGLHKLIVMERMQKQTIFNNLEQVESSLVLQNSIPNMLLDLHKGILGSGVTSLYQGIMHYLHSCGQFDKINDVISLDTAEKRVSRELTKVWMSIFNNYSLILKYTLNGIRICTNGDDKYASGSSSKIAETTAAFSVGFGRVGYKDKLFYTSDFPSKRVTRNFRFVSCGTRTISSLQFVELIKIFDQWIWVAIASSFLITSVISEVVACVKLRNTCGFWYHCLSHVKVLLEQGDPYANELLKIAPLRWLIGSYLVVGIVLSNAYKNSNVYNLITPRKPLPFETFDELESENFTIYSPIGNIVVDNNFRHQTTTTVSIHNGGAGSANFLTGLSEYHILVSSEVETYMASMIQNNSSRKMKDALSLNPLIVDWVTRVYKNVSKIVLPEEQYILSQMNFLKKQEMDYFIDLMVKCEKIALVLKSDVSTNTVLKVKHKRHFLPLSVGKETYYGTNELLVMSGFVPRRVLTRLKGIGESGIWDWLMEITSKSDSGRNAAENPPVQAANMGGNLIVLFVVWLTGLGLSAVYFLCGELLWKARPKFRCPKIPFTTFQSRHSTV